MMETGTWGESHFLLYLEDLSRGIWLRTTHTSLREAHRALIAFCTRKMAGMEGEARRAVAERLCVLRGYATGAVGEADADGEDALVRAAADGAVGAAGVRLLMEAGAVSGGEALVAAAMHGQREAVAGLIDNGVDVDSRAEKVMRGAALGLSEKQIEIESIMTESCQKWVHVPANQEGIAGRICCSK